MEITKKRLEQLRLNIVALKEQQFVALKEQQSRANRQFEHQLGNLSREIIDIIYPPKKDISGSKQQTAGVHSKRSQNFHSGRDGEEKNNEPNESRYKNFTH